MIYRTFALAFIIGLSACQPAQEAELDFSRETVIETVRVLSADDMTGRATATEGNAKARAYLLEQLSDMGLDPAGESYAMPFSFAQKGEGEADTQVSGVNLIARIDGETPGQGPVMVVTAHYDHLGIRDGEIYNGADDNASGVAALLAVAQSFQAVPPQHDVILALLDAEEVGWQGAYALLQAPPVARERIALNLNLDMLSKNDRDELYVAGAFHHPFLAPLLSQVAADAPLTLIMGHDDPALGSDDWTLQSDHAPFHQAGIPFVYFGVEDHPEYHKPSDDFATIPQDFYLRAVETVVMAAHVLDENLETISEKAGTD